MARANLTVSIELKDAFVSAQSYSSNVRFLKVSIKDESLTLSNTINCVSSAGEDFNTLLVDSVGDKEATLILYNLSDKIESTSSRKRWLLVAWICDSSKVRYVINKFYTLLTFIQFINIYYRLNIQRINDLIREKMLYSSSKDDLKNTLGVDFFIGEYNANNRDDLNWQTYQSSISKDIAVGATAFSSAEISHVKPKAPGLSNKKSTVAKFNFKCDDDI